MAAVNLTIDVPVFNFDIIQGQDLEIPILYETTGVADTLLGGALKMEVRSFDYATVIDTLTSSNDRIVITGANAFTFKFPNAKTNTYKPITATLKLIYKIELTVAGKTKRLFEGTITVKRGVK
jgi:hypothetical protein